MKKILSYSIGLLSCMAFLLSVESCADDVDNGGIPTVRRHFTATIENQQTKTSYGEKVNGTYPVSWSKGDSISVMTSGDGPWKFTTPWGTDRFSGNIPEGTTEPFFALYPYSADASMSDGKLTFSLPDTQIYKEGNLSDGAFPMVAYSNSEEFNFMNICGILRLQLLGTGSVSYITIDASVPVAGKVSVDLPYDDAPSMDLSSDGSKTVKLICTNPVALNETTATSFNIVLPPQTYDGMTITIMTSDGHYMVKNVSASITVNRARMITASAFTLLADRYGDARTDRAALTALFNATGGNHWTEKTNWCTDKDLSTWKGVSVDGEGRVVKLSLGGNNLNGSLPQAISNLTHLKDIHLEDNYLSGKIPELFTKYEVWKNSWYWVLKGNGFDRTGLVIPGPVFSAVDLDGNSISSETEYAKHSYTVMFHWSSTSIDACSYATDLENIYNYYHSFGVAVIGYSNEPSSNLKSEISILNIPWSNFSNTGDTIVKPYINTVPAVNVVDSEGKTVFNCLYDDKDSLEAFFSKIYGPVQSGTYVSSDYSADGTVKTLQAHSVGNGIKLILTGDGFVDKDYSNGTFANWMNVAMEKFFEVEPYKTFRDRFDVYTVGAVSKNRGVKDSSETIFSCYFGEGTAIFGDDTKVFKYAGKVTGADMTKSLVIVVLNSSNYAGTTFMYYDNSAIAYCPIIYYDDEAFGQVLNHEAGGHGFGKLYDEYSYSGTLPSEQKTSFISNRDQRGWGTNVDVTSSRTEIQWADFLSNSLYSSQVGIYEGAMTYEYGAWRPTYNSIMRENTDGFNAPSRKAIYKRIMELSGEDYTWDKFLSYDAVNRTTSSTSSVKMRTLSVNKADKPFSSPKTVKGSWRDSR